LALSVNIVRSVQVLGAMRQPGPMLYGDENSVRVVLSGVFSGLPQAVERIRSQERKMMDLSRRAEFKVGELHGRFLE
jgi:hypothetical protein